MIQAFTRRVDSLKDSVARVGIDLTVAGARRVPAFREHILHRVSDVLGRTYVETESDRELLANQLWFGKSLKPFLLRMLDEHPRTVGKLIHLAYVWARDVRRRTRAAQENVVTPVTFVIEPTGRCNLKCPGCYANSTSRGEELPYQVLRRLIGEARDMGVTLVTMSGGEPFLREAEDQTITRLAGEFQNNGFLVYTNATMIDSHVAERLGKVENVFPAISVEGYESETDARRGRGYSSSALNVRRMLAEHQVMYGFSATVTNKNAHILSSDEFIARRIEEGDMFGWYFLMQPIGRRPDTSLLVTPEQRARLRDQIFKWRAEGRPIFIGDFWNDGPFVGGCIAGGRSYFHVYANGDISPCVFAPIACGNVKDIFSGKSEYTSLADFVNRHPLFRGFREKQKKITDWRAPCLLFDNPEMLRDLCKHAPWFPANNMPKGYLDGEIAKAIDDSSRRWREALRTQPRMPECVRHEPVFSRSA